MPVFWITEKSLSRDSRVYSSGRLSRAHAVFEKDCAACHVQQAGSFSAKATDSACLDCHDGPMHHPVGLIDAKHLACAECHTEHKGRSNVSAASSQACAECHADLSGENGPSHYVRHIRSFADGHPEFAALREDNLYSGRDPSGIRLNHAIHLKPIRRSPNGPLVTLECGNCHRPAAAGPDLTYSDGTYRMASVTYRDPSTEDRKSVV